MFEDFVVLDLETTGLNRFSCHILEVALIRVSNWRIVAKYSELLDPGPISEEVARITGLTDADVQGARRANDEAVGDTIRAFVGRSPIVGHNVHFDLSFLANHHPLRIPPDFLDTRALALALFPYKKTTLDATCEHCGIQRSNSHRAYADAYDTLRCLEAMSRGLSSDAIRAYVNKVYGFRKYASTPPYVPVNGELILL
jgi:DNA polymerase III epsilon subunit-like protein